MKTICPNKINTNPGSIPNIPQNNNTEKPNALVGTAMGKSTKASRNFLPLKLYRVNMIEIGKAIMISIPTAIAAIVNE